MLFERLGTYATPVLLKLKFTASPKTIPPPSVPYSKQASLKVELENLESQGVTVRDDKLT